jgi:hypothetical protein
VVLSRSYLAFVVACGLCGIFGTAVARALIDATVDIGCGLLVVLLVPLLASLGALLSTLDGDAG